MIATIVLAIAIAAVAVGSGSLVVRRVRRSHASVEAAAHAEVADWLHELLDAVPGPNDLSPVGSAARSEPLRGEDGTMVASGIQLR